MKLNFDQNLLNRTISNVIVVIAGIAFFMLIQHFKQINTFIQSVADILTPFFLGFVIAYLLNRPVNRVDRTLERCIKSPSVRRGVAVAIGLLICLILISILLAFLLPQLMDSVIMLMNNVQSYITNIEQLFMNITANYDINPTVYEKLMELWDDFMNTASAMLLNVVQRLIGMTGQVTNGIVNLFVAIIISVYALYSKERFFAQIRKILYATCSPQVVERSLYVSRLVNTTFNGFIIGKLIDSLIIGILAFICLSIMKMPYVLLISVIIGVTNVIPFFGPFVGAIPSAFIILIVDPVKSFWFIIFILVLQQIDGNIIGPKILGDSTGLPAIWVLFAILVGGGIAGFAGMILGVPTFAVIYALIKEKINNNLITKGMTTKTEEYASSKNPIKF